MQSSLRASSPIREGSERETTHAWAASPFACGSRVTCRDSPNMESWLVARLSQSPSLFISGSGSWPQREGLLSLSFAFVAENYRSRFALVKKFEPDLLASLGRSLCAILYLTQAKYPETRDCSCQFFKVIISSVEMPFLCSTRKLCFRGLLVCSAQKWTRWWCWRMLGFDCKRKVIWLVFTTSCSSYFAFWSHRQVNCAFFLCQRFAGSGTGGTTVSFEGSETSQPNAQDKGEWEVSWIWFVYE